MQAPRLDSRCPRCIAHVCHEIVEPAMLFAASLEHLFGISLRRKVNEHGGDGTALQLATRLAHGGHTGSGGRERKALLCVHRCLPSLLWVASAHVANHFGGANLGIDRTASRSHHITTDPAGDEAAWLVGTLHPPVKALTLRAIGRLVVVDGGITSATSRIGGVTGGRPDVRKIPFRPRLTTAGVDTAPESPQRLVGDRATPGWWEGALSGVSKLFGCAP